MTHRSGGLGVAGLLLGSILVIAGCTGGSAVSTPSQPPSPAPATKQRPRLHRRRPHRRRPHRRRPHPKPALPCRPRRRLIASSEPHSTF